MPSSDVIFEHFVHRFYKIFSVGLAHGFLEVHCVWVGPYEGHDLLGDESKRMGLGVGLDIRLEELMGTEIRRKGRERKKEGCGKDHVFDEADGSLNNAS